MIHVMTYDELRAALMSYLFDRETYCEDAELLFPRRRWAWRFDPQRGLPQREVTHDSGRGQIMGADMTIAICARHVDKHVAEARLKTLSNAVIGSIYNYGDDLEDDDDTDYVARAIKDLSWVYAETRQTCIFYIDGKEYVVSGGFSWGDDPTDAYGSLNAISGLGVTELEFPTEVTA